jgi:putative ABC transport system ATP-binding protein
MTASPILTVEGLRCEVGGRDLFGAVDLTVAGGESVALMGPSGSGKTTLLAALAGLGTPAAGEVRLDGEPVRAGRTTGIAVVLQGYGLVSLLTAAENVEVALRAAGDDPDTVGEPAAEALAELGLADHADQLVEELSGGQQQRVAIARAVALHPRVLLADEPTAEQDRATRAIVLSRLFDVTHTGAALLIATHDPEVAERCDRVVSLARQELVAGER